jgi:hypothetical protein
MFTAMAEQKALMRRTHIELQLFWMMRMWHNDCNDFVNNCFATSGRKDVVSFFRLKHLYTSAENNAIMFRTTTLCPAA